MRTFDLGGVVATANALRQLEADEIILALKRHAFCDWGDVGEEDWKTNNQALKSGDRLVSSYKSKKGDKFLIITEADRSITTVLMPEDY